MLHSCDSAEAASKEAEVKFSFYKPAPQSQSSATPSSAGVAPRLSVAERCRLLELREKVLEHKSYEVCCDELACNSSCR